MTLWIYESSSLIKYGSVSICMGLSDRNLLKCNLIHRPYPTMIEVSPHFFYSIQHTSTKDELIRKQSQQLSASCRFFPDQWAEHILNLYTHCIILNQPCWVYHRRGKKRAEKDRYQDKSTFSLSSVWRSSRETFSHFHLESSGPLISLD